LIAALGLAACGRTVSITTSFTVTTLSGHGPSPFDVLANQGVSLSVVLDGPAISHDHEMVGNDVCRVTRAQSENAQRTASGDTADLVQTQILDPLPEWAAQLETCVAPDNSYTSSLGIVAVIDPLNVRLDCSTVPQSVTAHDAAGYPELVTFEATDCTAQILDVVNNRSLEATGFVVDLDTGGDQVP
jgi:hypothetical protein